MIASLLLTVAVWLALSVYSLLLLAIFGGRAWRNGITEGIRRERTTVAHLEALLRDSA